MSNKKLKKSIDRQVYKATKRDVAKILNKKFEEIKKEMIQDFESHSVTREIEAGPGASNISSTLSRGNLFSFIGFDRSEKPLEVIRKALHESRIFITKSSTGHFSISATIPSREDLFAMTPLPWAKGRSWLKGIEHGISGLGRYLYGQFSSSKSGTGIQTGGNKGGKFKNTSYISKILKTASVKIEKMK